MDNKTMDKFFCRANDNGYCKMWVRETCCDSCLVKEDCPCAYCKSGSISPKHEENPCAHCIHFNFKISNYVE